MRRPYILVVDDEPDVVELIERALALEQIDVVSAYDGLSALDLAETERPDLILLDIMMPMMSGYEVAEQLKANPQTRHIPIVCLTSATSLDAQLRSTRAGAAGLIQKPFIPSRLIEEIRSRLAKKEAEEQA